MSFRDKIFDTLCIMINGNLCKIFSLLTFFSVFETMQDVRYETFEVQVCEKYWNLVLISHSMPANTTVIRGSYLRKCDFSLCSKWGTFNVTAVKGLKIKHILFLNSVEENVSYRCLLNLFYNAFKIITSKYIFNKSFGLSNKIMAWSYLHNTKWRMYNRIFEDSSAPYLITLWIWPSFISLSLSLWHFSNMMKIKKTKG
jgi:hypothetical protein